MKVLTPLIMIGSMILAAMPAHAEDEFKALLAGPDFKARIHISNRNVPQMSSRSDVWVGKHGFRIASLGPDGEQLVTLVKGEDTYMLFPAQRMYFSANEVEKEADNVVDEGPMVLFVNKPCLGFKKSRQSGQALVGTRKTTKWRCANAQGIADTVQYFDDKLGRVIKTDMPDGTVSELSNIVQKPIPDSLFDIPGDYKKMSLADMMNPAGMSLQSYPPGAR